MGVGSTRQLPCWSLLPTTALWGDGRGRAGRCSALGRWRCRLLLVFTSLLTEAWLLRCRLLTDEDPALRTRLFQVSRGESQAVRLANESACCWQAGNLWQHLAVETRCRQAASECQCRSR